MQLFVIDWSFENNEDQLFATNEFCQYLNEGILNETIEGFDLKFIAHTPQNKSGVIICLAQNTSVLFKILKFWRESFNITFNFKPALTNEELLSSQNEKVFWSKE
ncbi:Hypothetical protein P9515_12091 [Prochlorococcus marinus str. MIT 9515]|uniref:DUF3303 domain-containing protein n=1 Tax=Prochlorococcus marinus (strain MIT 9515) TaxID=167542 RepID=A2BXA5_PROM5|nr:DUF3303 family protein [Prochlorococcus marinus]ABM72416.1 Hypothetical protein P9515_12091 [Prochlorococcus marinus str. MIT 9515]